VTKQEFLRELADVLNEDPADVTDGKEVNALDGWDSAGLLGVIAMLDSELDLQVDVDRLRGCKTVGDLVALAGDKLQ